MFSHRVPFGHFSVSHNSTGQSLTLQTLNSTHPPQQCTPIDDANHTTRRGDEQLHIENGKGKIRYALERNKFPNKAENVHEIPIYSLIFWTHKIMKTWEKTSICMLDKPFLCIDFPSTNRSMKTSTLSKNGKQQIIFMNFTDSTKQWTSNTATFELWLPEHVFWLKWSMKGTKESEWNRWMNS